MISARRMISKVSMALMIPSAVLPKTLVARCPIKMLPTMLFTLFKRTMVVMLREGCCFIFSRVEEPLFPCALSTFAIERLTPNIDVSTKEKVKDSRITKPVSDINCVIYSTDYSKKIPKEKSAKIRGLFLVGYNKIILLHLLEPLQV